VHVSGDVESWPIITVVGPGQNPSARNLTTGASWTVTTSLAAGQRLVVDHRPGWKRVTIDDANAYPLLTSDSSLWSLAPGDNKIELALANTDPTASITLNWENAWLAA